MTRFLPVFFCSGALAFISHPFVNKHECQKDQGHHSMICLHETTGYRQEYLDDSKQEDLAKLVSLFGGSPSNLLRLSSSADGIRGVYLNEPVHKGDIILKMPMSSVIRDDEPPVWLNQQQEGDEFNVDHTVQIQGWVTRLAARILEAQRNIDELPVPIQQWLHLLPKSLKENLPVYWPESTLQYTDCRALELAVDSAYFARAKPLSDLSASNMTHAQIEHALDLVQTRACRCSSSTSPDDQSTNDLRVLVPIFDMINHHYEPNAEFFRQGESMVVRALEDIGQDNEIFIHYGTSTMPVWKCLLSYGFVPSVDDIYEHYEAGIVVDNNRFDLTPTEIPFDLVQHVAQSMGIDDDEDIEFTPEIGLAIVDKIVTSAKALEAPVSPESNFSKTTHQLVKDLRESHRRTLLACAGGLKDYIEGL